MRSDRSVGAQVVEPLGSWSCAVDFNLAQVAAAVAQALPDRTYFVKGETSLTYREFMARSHRLGNALHERGLGCQVERDNLAGHESGQDHIGVLTYNCHEHLEALIGAYSARVAPFNVNYRYVDDELIYLLTDQRAVGLVYQSEFAATIARIRDRVPDVRVLVQIADQSEHELLDGAEWYEDVLANQPPTPPPATLSPDDLYILCTGGTTGMPKGVLWRQADIFVNALGGSRAASGEEYDSIDQIVQEAVGRGDKFRNVAVAPFMHGAAQWLALTALTQGSCVVVPSNTRAFDPADIWATVERTRGTMMQIVGDAFARPLLDELDRRAYDLNDLRIITNGGAVLSARAKERLTTKLPGVKVIDRLGTSEAGSTGLATSRRDAIETTTFEMQPNTVVLSEDLSRPLTSGEDELGWMAMKGHLPLGYLGDAEKTAQTFPTVGGTRYVVAGDRARLVADGRLELLGRDSVTINTGGEKVFAEEVEQALLTHDAVADVVACGRPSDRWGSEVVAVVALRPGAQANLADLRAAAGAHIAAYKLPKAVVFRDRIERSPSGKADYRWALSQVTDTDVEQRDTKRRRM